LIFCSSNGQNKYLKTQPTYLSCEDQLIELSHSQSKDPSVMIDLNFPRVLKQILARHPLCQTCGEHH